MEIKPMRFGIYFRLSNFLRLFFLLMISVIFDIRDRHQDDLKKRKTMATMFSNRIIIAMMLVLLIGYGILLIQGIHSMANPLFLIGLSITGCLAFVVFLLSLWPRGYYFYYLLTDGLMLLSSIVTYVATI